MLLFIFLCDPGLYRVISICPSVTYDPVIRDDNVTSIAYEHQFNETHKCSLSESIRIIDIFHSLHKMFMNKNNDIVGFCCCFKRYWYTVFFSVHSFFHVTIYILNYIQ